MFIGPWASSRSCPQGHPAWISRTVLLVSAGLTHGSELSGQASWGLAGPGCPRLDISVYPTRSLIPQHVSPELFSAAGQASQKRAEAQTAREASTWRAITPATCWSEQVKAKPGLKETQTVAP